MTYMKKKREKGGRRGGQSNGGLGFGPNRQPGIGCRKNCLCELTAPTTASTHMADSMRTHPPCSHQSNRKPPLTPASFTKNRAEHELQRTCRTFRGIALHPRPCRSAGHQVTREVGRERCHTTFILKW